MKTNVPLVAYLLWLESNTVRRRIKQWRIKATKDYDEKKQHWSIDYEDLKKEFIKQQIGDLMENNEAIKEQLMEIANTLLINKRKQWTK